jgi:hypothetical protein
MFIFYKIFSISFIAAMYDSLIAPPVIGGEKLGPAKIQPSPMPGFFLF